MPSPLQCHGCRHFAWAAIDSDRCAAFIDGIPDPIWLGDVDHTAPFAGDGGVHRDPSGEAARVGLQLRREVWKKRAVERFAHESDPLGVIVAGLSRRAADAVVDQAALSSAWQVTHDAPAMLLVLLRAKKTAELARAIHLTSAQLEAEGCDYLDEKGWLGVSLCLGSYQTEAALENGRAAWSALSSPFSDGYLTARVHQTLLRLMRRVVPDPPFPQEWAGSEIDSEGIGPLDDAVVAMRVAPIKKTVRIEDVALLEPWTAVTNAQGLEAELARELVAGHRLFGRPGLRAIARRTDCDDVLFVNDSIAAVVHLTWAKEAEPTFPSAELFASVEEWVTRRMNPDHDDFAGQAPRAFAYEFKSALTLDQMREKLPDKTRWEWTLRDSAWYGDYLWAKDGSTRVRIFSEDGPERFAIQADLVDPDDPGKDWFPATRSLVVDTFLPSLEATDLVETTPEYD